MGYLYLFQQARTFVVADRGSKGKVLFLLRDLTQNVRILGNSRYDWASEDSRERKRNKTQTS